MYERILVPLDGSKLAECALPYAEELAKGCSAQEVILVSVTEQVRARTSAPEAKERWYSSQIHGTTMIDSTVPNIPRLEDDVVVTYGKKERQAQRYLEKIARSLKAKGINVRTDVLYWPPAEAISSYAENNDVSVIVMSSHGRSGPSRWAYGSVADRVFRSSCVPVLMVRAPGCVAGF